MVVAEAVRRRVVAERKAPTKSRTAVARSLAAIEYTLPSSAVPSISASSAQSSLATSRAACRTASNGLWGAGMPPSLLVVGLLGADRGEGFTRLCVRVED